VDLTAPPTYPISPESPPSRPARKRVLLAAAVLVVVAAVIAAIVSTTGSSSKNGSKAAVAPTTTTAPSALTVFTDKTDGYAISVPSGWQRVDTSSPGSLAALTALENEEPYLDAVLGGSANQVLAEGVRFVAVDTSGAAANSPTEVAVAVHAGLTAGDLNALEDELPSAYAQLGAKVLGTSDVMLDGNPALEVTADLPIGTSSAGSALAHETQYFIEAGTKLFILAMSGTGAELPAIAASFKILS
jgi:hypothetical protein